MAGTSRRWGRTVVCLALLLPPGGALAQDQGAAVQSPPPQPAQPSVLTAIEVPEGVDSASVLLRAMRRHSTADAEVDAILARLPATHDGIEADRRQVEESRAGRISVRAFEGLRREWRRHEHQLEGWTVLLRSRSSGLQADLARLDDLAATWTATLAALETQGAPEELRASAQSILRLTEETRKLLVPRLDSLLRAQATIAQDFALAGDVTARLEEAMAGAAEWNLRQEVPAIWRAPSSQWSLDSILANLSGVRSERMRDLGDFLGYSGEWLVLHVVLLVPLLGLVLLLRAPGARLAQRDPRLEGAAAVLRRPLATTFLLWLLLTPWVHRQPPLVVLDLMFLGLVVPLLRLLPLLVHRTLVRSSYALVLLVWLSDLVDRLSPFSDLHRLGLLAVAGAGSLVLAWASRPGGSAATAAGSGWFRAALLVGRGAAALLLVSVLANVLGRLSLAETLGRGALGSAYVGLLVYCGVVVLESLWLLAVSGWLAARLRSVRVHQPVVEARGAWILHTVAVALWSWSTLTLFRAWDGLYSGVATVLGHPWVLGAVSISLGGVLAFALALWISVLLSRLVRFLLAEDVLPRLELERGVGATISMLSNYAVLALGFVLALGAAGLELSQLMLIISALGVGIGFGLQGLVNNFLSGLILVFERPIRIGDTVEVGTLSGTVDRIGWRASIVRTFEGSEVIVPNGNLTTHEVINWTLSDATRRLEVQVGVAYGSDPQRVQELLLGCASKHSEVLKKPEPSALFQAFGESSLDFTLRFWTGNFRDFVRIRSEVTGAVYDALRDAGIEIPFPQRDVHLKSDVVPGKLA